MTAEDVEKSQRPAFWPAAFRRRKKPFAGSRNEEEKSINIKRLRSFWRKKWEVWAFA